MIWILEYQIILHHNHQVLWRYTSLQIDAMKKHFISYVSPEEQFRNWRNVENILHFYVEPICLSVKNSILTMFIWKCSMLIHLSSNYPVWQKSLSYAESFLLIVNSACCNFYINLNFWFWYNVVDLCVQYLDHDFEIIFPKIVCLGCFIGSFSIQHSQTKGFIGI